MMSPFPADAKVGPRMHQEMVQRGLFTRMRGEVVCLAPPLVTTPEQVDRMVEILRDAMPAALRGV